MIRSSAEDLFDKNPIFLFYQMVKKRVPTSYDIGSDISKSIGKFSSFKYGKISETAMN